MEKQNKRDDTAFVTLLDQIRSLDDEGIILLNPITSNQMEILSNMFTRGRWMSDREDEFTEFVTAPSISAVKQQIFLHKASIMETLNGRKHGKSTNYELIPSKINELKRLNHVLSLQVIEESLIECVKHVSKAWNERCEEAMKRLK